MSVLKNFPLASGVFFVLFVLSGALAKSSRDLSSRTGSDSESLEEIQDGLLRRVQLEMKMASEDVERTPVNDDDEEENGDVTVNSIQCNCTDVECSCCRLIIQLRTRDNCCVTMTYEPDKKSILVYLTLGSHSFPPEKVHVSVTQPPPIFYDVRKISWLASMRIEFHNYKLEEDSVNGCLKFKAKTFGRVDLDIDLGCFHMALTSTTIQHVGEVEPMYFEEDKDLAEGPEPIYPW